MGARHAEQQAVVSDSPQACFDALVDYETFPEWQEAVKRCQVLTRDEEGRGEEVEFDIDARVREISYRLRYSYEEPHLIEWDFLDGDVNDVEGSFVLEDRGDGTTLATYSLRIDPGVWLPGRLAKLLNEQVMKRSVEDLKRRVEQG